MLCLPGTTAWDSRELHGSNIPARTQNYYWTFQPLKRSRGLRRANLSTFLATHSASTMCKTRVSWLAFVFLFVPHLSCVAAVDVARHFAPQRWYCSEDRGHSTSMLCKTAKLKEAIAAAMDQDDKQARVNEFKAAVLKGEAEAEGLDATNPERQVRYDRLPHLAHLHLSPSLASIAAPRRSG